MPPAPCQTCTERSRSVTSPSPAALTFHSSFSISPALAGLLFQLLSIFRMPLLYLHLLFSFLLAAEIHLLLVPLFVLAVVVPVAAVVVDFLFSVPVAVVVLIVA